MAGMSRPISAQTGLHNQFTGEGLPALAPHAVTYSLQSALSPSALASATNENEPLPEPLSSSTGWLAYGPESKLLKRATNAIVARITITRKIKQRADNNSKIIITIAA